MNWFRFYHAALDDPKVQFLEPTLFKAWVNLLCLASEGKDRGFLPPIEAIAFRLRTNVEAAQEIVNALIEHRLLDAQDGVLMMHNWPTRQPSSDDVNARVTKHREGKKQGETLQETLQKRKCNALDKSREDTEKNREEKSSLTLTSPNGSRATPQYSNEFLTFWNQYPNGHGSKKVAFEVWQRLKPDDELQLDIMASLAKWNASEQWQQGYIKDAERFLRNRMWEVDPPPPKPLAPARNKAQEQVDMLKRIAMEAQS